jgi:hypothetical protein
MSRSDAEAPGKPDWRSWLALAWAAWFGVLYARMVLEERAPGVLLAIERASESVRTWCR